MTNDFNKTENEKPITKRMQALTNLAHYSTGIILKIPTEFIDKDTGEDWKFTDKLKESINCLIKDGRTEVMIAKDYWNDNQTVIDITVINDD